jgi:nitrate/nitrite transport system permease protein
MAATVIQMKSGSTPPEPPTGSAAVAPPAAAPPPRPARRVRAGARHYERLYSVLNVAGLGFLVPLVRMARGEDARVQMAALWRLAFVPLIAMGIFLFLWSQSSARIVTSLGQIPGPKAVWAQVGTLWADHRAERLKEGAFYERRAVRNAQTLAEDPQAEVSDAKYTGKPTYIDQIFTSLRTVFAGFLFASLVAIPIGILCGLSATMSAAFNPFIQIFKPVSPLAWLPIVTMVVSALYVSDNPMFEKSFINSSITVALCSMWPTLINTALGVSSIDKDLLNVSKVLKLGWPTKLFRIVLPSSLPLIFTGLRLSLGVGWMVLIAAEMLAQNPGLGKFVWDEFQNGSSDSLSRLLVAVFTIGFIGFLLDRVMYTIQSLVSFKGDR